MSRNLLTAIAVLLAVFATGCAHQLEVTNLQEFKKPATHGPRQKVAVLPFKGEAGNAPLFEHVTRALAAHPSVAELRTDWSGGSSEAGFRPDLVVEVDPRVEYSGSGWNFPITFPGFLIFTYAWNGFVYSGDITTDYKVYRPDGREEIASSSLKTEYSIRHCDFGRAFWASTGWYLPGYGATSALAGLYMITYDSDATEPFIETIRGPYGEYVAESILGPFVELARAGKKPAPLADLDEPDQSPEQRYALRRGR